MYSDKTYRVTLPQKQVLERNIPTDADVQNLLNHAKPELRLAIVLASVGTLRRGEICGLKYKDVLRDFNAIYVHSDVIKSTNGWVYKEMPKNDSSVRRVIFPKEVIDMIGQGDDEEFIYPFKPNVLTQQFIKLRDKLGLKCKFHDLRHYAASTLHAIGVPDVYIMERGGWANDSTLKSIYRNVLNDKSAHFTSIANDYFENKLDMTQNMTRKI
jgi:integrase